MARLNDTKALASRGMDSGECEKSVSSRKIANGYLVRESYSNYGTGEYRSTETFSKNPPNLDGGSRDAAGSGMLAETKRYLGNDV